MIKKAKSFIVIDRGVQEIRYAWAASAGKRIRIKALGRLLPTDSTEGQTRASDLQSILQDIQTTLGLRKSDLILLLPRTEIEETQASLPIAETDEFSQLVYSQAQETWPESVENAIVDYYQRNSSQSGMKDIMIAALGMDRKKEILRQVEAVGWRMTSMQLKYLNAVNLLRDQIELTQHPLSILINLGSQSADLIIMLRDQIAAIRTIPMPVTEWTEADADRIKLELQRGLMMVRHPDQAEATEKKPIFMFGRTDELNAISHSLLRDNEYEIIVKDPLSNFDCDSRSEIQDLHQFASLIGGLIEAPEMNRVDFAKPKCRKKFPKLYRRLITYGSAAALAMILLIYTGLNDVSQARQANADLRDEIKKIDEQIADMKKRTAVVDAINRWEREEVNWLEELRGLSLRFPSRDKAQVRSMSMSINPSRRGVISMNVRSRDESVISSLEQAIRDEYHQVRTSSLSQSTSEGDFGWQFNAAVSIVPRQKIDLAADPVLAETRIGKIDSASDNVDKQGVYPKVSPEGQASNQPDRDNERQVGINDSQQEGAQ